jgi:hypothetical protein
MTIQFELPAADAAAKPAFSNAKECADWLDALPLTNAATAQMQLRAQLDALARCGTKPAVLFEMLEVLREPFGFVQTEMAKKFVHRALHLADLELAARNNSLLAWKAYRTACLICLQSLLDGARDLKGAAAAVCHRAIDAHARMMIDEARTNCEASADDWAVLHQIYSAAEALGVEAEKVKDPLSQESPVTNCMAVYAQPVLVTLGSYNEWTARQSAMILRWLERWSTKITITATPPASPVKPPVLTDLDSTRGGFRPQEGGPAAGPGVRYLDIGELSLSIKNRVILLRKGETPVNLGLGEDCVMPGCEQQLINLYQHWCDGRVDRNQVRRPANGNALLAVGLEVMHYYLSGKPFKQPGEVKELTSKQRQEIATFGRIATRDEDEYSQIHGYAMEQWQLRDESMAGMRILRAKGVRGQRIAAGTIIAARPDGAKGFMLGTVRWVQWLTDDSIMTGVRAIPGTPMPVALRQTGINAAKEKYHQGFLVPAVEALKTPDTVLMPAGWFKPGKVIEVYADKPWRITLIDVIERGSEFERCSYGGAA